ncbi:TadE family type IV pilus minor pilin [Actinokineospora sp. 24-640]
MNGRSDRGAVTVEAALAVATLAFVLVLVLAGGSAAIDQIRCVDAAREAARQAARGDPERARSAAEHLAPAGAEVRITYTDDTVVVHVEAPAARVLPGLRLRADAHAALEPGAQQGEGDGQTP